MPANYTFTASDKGSHAFSITLKSAGTQTITATDTTGSAMAGTSAGVAVSPAAAGEFVISGLSSSATAGVGQTFTVTAKDPYGNVATGYTGTVHFASSDAAATLPANYTFKSTDAGSHAFSVTFATAGSQSVTVSDTSKGFAATQSGVNVAPAAPTNLSASAVSSSQINLSWTAGAGDGGYLLQRSLNGGSTWTQIASLSSGTTSYQDTGLSSATTYTYRVIATGGGLDSSPSNVVSATTAGATGSVDTIWSNSYTPAENAYSYGSYELGLKFTASTAGQVTGVRFYQESGMGGYTHVGHLWTSTGTLLATATFTRATGTGWQQVSFSSPVTIQANTVYIVSFSSGGGYFGISTSFFTRGGVTSGPLEALPNSTSGGDGVSGRSGSFPSVSGNGMNFWVDVAFVPSSTSSVKPAAKTSASAPTVSTGTFFGTTPAAAPSGPAGFAWSSRARPRRSGNSRAWGSSRGPIAAMCRKPERRSGRGPGTAHY